MFERHSLPINRACGILLLIAAQLMQLVYDLKTKRLQATAAKTKYFSKTAVQGLNVYLIVSDGDSVFPANLGNFQETSARHSGMWIYWRTLPSSDTG